VATLFFFLLDRTCGEVAKHFVGTSRKGVWELTL
jgi:hypothetical protein